MCGVCGVFSPVLRIYGWHVYIIYTATSRLRHSYVTATSQLPLKSLHIYDSPATILPTFCTFRSTEPCTLSVELPLTECSEVSPSYVEERRSEEERRSLPCVVALRCAAWCAVCDVVRAVVRTTRRVADASYYLFSSPSSSPSSSGTISRPSRRRGRRTISFPCGTT